MLSRNYGSLALHVDDSPAWNGQLDVAVSLDLAGAASAAAAWDREAPSCALPPIGVLS
eukprot:SAG22_NODE_56_length_23716_cov_11.146759_5_plen_58_part_00